MSYYDLLAIRDEAKLLADEQRRQPVLACPIDGEPLKFNSKGIGNCPFGNYRTSGPNATQGGSV